MPRSQEKKPKIDSSFSPTKKHGFTSHVGGVKTAFLGGDPDVTFKTPIAWNFRNMDSCGKWPCTLKSLDPYIGRLCHFEGRTVEDIFMPGCGDRHSHPIDIGRIISPAQTRLKNLNIGVGKLHQLSLNQKSRLWGFLQHNIFHILWLDENHEICPSD